MQSQEEMRQEQKWRLAGGRIRWGVGRGARPVLTVVGSFWIALEEKHGFFLWSLAGLESSPCWGLAALGVGEACESGLTWRAQAWVQV